MPQSRSSRIYYWLVVTTGLVIASVAIVTMQWQKSESLVISVALFATYGVTTLSGLGVPSHGLRLRTNGLLLAVAAVGLPPRLAVLIPLAGLHSVAGR